LHNAARTILDADDVPTLSKAQQRVVGEVEVMAALDVRYVEALEHEVWVAVPDWTTLIRK
jgi:hypothetical protein